MKLFFKHLAKSIKRKPAQPFVLILTLAIAVGVCIMSFGLNDCFAEENKLSTFAEYGNSDITLTLNGTSKSRFMFTDEVRGVLGDGAVAAGVFELPMFLGEGAEAVFGIATDFGEINEIFNFSFTDYGEVNFSNISEIAFISESFAKEKGLAVGERFDAKIVGGEKSYTVAAISPTKYISSYDVMVDIGGVMEVLASDSLLVSALGDSFKPCSTIYIDVKEDGEITKCKETLSLSESFSEKSIYVVSEDMRAESDAETMLLIISVAISFACILSVAVTFCCFYILAAERSEENASFSAAGAKSYQLNLLQYAEIILYWIIGGALGVGLGELLLKITVTYAGFEFSDGSVSFLNSIGGLLMILAASLITATVFIVSGGHERKSKKKNTAFLLVAICFAVAAALSVLTFSVPTQKAFLPGLLAMISIFAFSFVCSTLVFKGLLRLLNAFFERRLQKTQKLSFPALRYAVKNLFKVKVIHNFSRLITVLVAVVTASVFVIVSTDGYVLTAKRMIQSDYAVLNGTESCYEKLEALDAAESVSKSYFGSGTLLGGNYTPVISTRNANVFSDIMEISSLPENNEIIISRGQAEARELEEGDTSILSLNGNLYETVIAEILDCGMNVIIFDCEYFDVQYNMLLIDGAEGISNDALLHEITKETALELATVVTPDSLMHHRLGSINIYLDSGDVLLTVALVFAAIGMIDNLAQSYRERRPEFELYKAAGMSVGSIRRMKLFEILISLAFGLLLGLVAFALAMPVIERGMLAYGYSVFDAVAMLFK